MESTGSKLYVINNRLYSMIQNKIEKGCSGVMGWFYGNTPDGFLLKIKNLFHVGV
jgi:hypothetical protein